MSLTPERSRLTPEDLQTVDNVLQDTPTTTRTRRWLLERAALGAGLAAFGPVGTALARSSGSNDTVQSVGALATTFEALATTYLTQVVERLPGTPLAAHSDVFMGLCHAEFDHYFFLNEHLGLQPLSTHFWIPDAFFGSNLSGVLPTLQVAEDAFINAYLIGIVVFAGAGQTDLALYSGQTLGVEAEHRSVVRQFLGLFTPDRGFERYTHSSLSDIVAIFTGAGVGIGQQGSAPGAFYDYRYPGHDLLRRLDNNWPIPH